MLNEKLSPAFFKRPQRFCGLWLTLGLLMTHGLVQADSRSEVLAPFSSEYAVDYSGFNAVRSVTLRSESDEYILRSVLTLKGVARLSGYGPVYEESRFRVVDGIIQPLLYTIGEKKKNPDRDIRIEFDWDSSVSRGYAKGEAQEFELEAGFQDPLTFEIMARMLLASGERNFALKVHEGHRVREYTFIPKGEEHVNVASRAEEVDKYFIDRNSSRELYYWFDPDYLFLPLKITQVHGQKTKGTVSLRSSSLLD